MPVLHTYRQNMCRTGGGVCRKGAALIINPNFNLPEISFVAASTQRFAFHLYTKAGTPFSLEDTGSDFAVMDIHGGKLNLHVFIRQKSPQGACIFTENAV